MNTLTPDNKHAEQRSMNEQTRLPVLIQVRNESATSGVLLGKYFVPAQRYKRAALVWGILWLLAATSVFIPVAHFLLVPVFAIAGPILGYQRYRQEAITEAIEGKCPACLHAFQLPLDAQTALPHRDVCPYCDKHIQIQALDHEA